MPSAFHFFCISFEARDHFERGVATLGRVVRLFKRRAPERHHRVADVFVERAVVAEDDLRHVRQIFVEQRGEFLRVQFFRNGGEPAHVAEHHGDFRLARLHQIGIFQQPANHFRAQILLERAAHAPLFFFLDQRAIHRDETHVGDQRSRGNDEVQPPAMQERVPHAEAERHEQQQAEQHRPRLRQRQPQSQRHAEQKNQQQIHGHLIRAAKQEMPVQNVVDHVRVDFDARIIDSAKRRRAQIADSRRRRAHQHNFPLEGSRRRICGFTTSAMET